MSKEYLEAFKNLKQELYYSPNQIPDIDKWHETIEQALERLEAIDNANPSEALECLRYMCNDKAISDYILYNCFDEDIFNIKQSLFKELEQEKVLDIIINKNVSVWGFRNRVFGYQKEQNGNKIINDTYEYYLNNFGCYHNGFDIELLTKEEFNTLKEYFKC